MRKEIWKDIIGFMINIEVFTTCVLTEVLLSVGCDDSWEEVQSAIRLLLGTAAVESELGEYIEQIGGGPALGIFQMEPATHDDIWENYLHYAPEKADRVKCFESNPRAEALKTNPWYAAAMCRIHYYRSPERLPEWNAHVKEFAKMWKKVYNTPKGKGTIAKFVKKYETLVAPFAATLGRG